MGNILIGQSGGPTAVINASLVGAFEEGQKYSDIVYGMINGIEGFLQGKFVNLNKQINTSIDLELLKRTPSSYLGSCRYKLPEIAENEEIYIKIFSLLKKLNIDKVLYIGGNDSMDTIKKLHLYSKKNNAKINFIGIPKTIDNDLAITDHTPGFGSACKYIATSIKEIIKDSTVYDMKKITIVEIMGRNSGFLTASAGITKSDDCSGVDLIYLPEIVFDIDEFVKKVCELQKVKKSLVIAVSEGIKDKNGQHICEMSVEHTIFDSFGHKTLSGTATMLAHILSKHIDCSIRGIEINTLQRCASHIMSKTDMEESYLAGVYGARFVYNEKSGQVVIFKRISNRPYNIEITYHSVDDIANEEKTVPLDWIDTKNISINENFINYITPLIDGEVYPIMVNGLPKHLKLNI